MRTGIFGAAIAMALATAPVAPAHAGGLAISKCQTRALIGGGVGAVVGSMVAGKGAKTEGAILGGALGAAAGFGICKYMDKRSYSRVENGYQTAVQRNRSYSSSWTGEDGSRRTLSVPKPKAVSGNCRVLNGTMTITNAGRQALPQETYCQGADGVWRPA
jgi:surface antigen